MKTVDFQKLLITSTAFGLIVIMSSIPQDSFLLISGNMNVEIMNWPTGNTNLLKACSQALDPMPQMSKKNKSLRLPRPPLRL